MSDPETITPADAFRHFLRADYPQEPHLPDEITGYSWFAFRRHRSSEFCERSQMHDAIVLALAKRAMKKLRENVRDGMIRLQGTLDPKIAPTLIKKSEQLEGDLDVFKRRLEVGPRVYSEVLCLKADVVASGPASSPERRGRKPKLFWRDVDKHIFDLFDHHSELSPDDPEWQTQADVERAVSSYCELKGWAASESTIRRHVGQFLEQRKKGRQGP
jgi:hypothetical protein